MGNRTVVCGNDRVEGVARATEELLGDNKVWSEATYLDRVCGYYVNFLRKAFKSAKVASSATAQLASEALFARWLAEALRG